MSRARRDRPPSTNETSVGSYLQDGCGRCEKYRTPECKVHLWTGPLVALRALLVATGLEETMKWGSPCYTLAGKNVVMLSALQDCCLLSFFKGSVLADPEGLLEWAGPNSRVAKVLKFRSIDEVAARREAASRLVEAAMAAERAGVKVAAGGGPEVLPEELEQRLAADPDLHRAFEALTPGRQRSHAIHVAGAKAAATREARVARCVPKILAGKGFLDR